MHYFGDKSLFILGRNDMDTRELFQQINPEFLRAIKEHQQITTSNVKFKELTDKVGYHLIAVDELTNSVPDVRAQLFNLFDGFIEIDGKAYPIGSDYSIWGDTFNYRNKIIKEINKRKTL